MCVTYNTHVEFTFHTNTEFTMSEVEQYELAEREMEILTRQTGKPCKIIAGEHGTYQAVVIGSCGHFDAGISKPANRTEPLAIEDEGVLLEF